MNTTNKPNPVATAIIMFIMAAIFIISCSKVFSQDGISFSVLQDVKLGLGLDKKHKNDTPTLDMIFNVNLEGNQFEYYYFSVQAFYEYAALYSGNYHRYGVNALCNLNKLIVRNLQISPGIGLGMINRPRNEGNGSYSFLLETKYYFSNNFGVIIKNEWVRRTDLKTPKLGYNLSFGVTYKI